MSIHIQFPTRAELLSWWAQQSPEYLHSLVFTRRCHREFLNPRISALSLFCCVFSRMNEMQAGPGRIWSLDCNPHPLGLFFLFFLDHSRQLDARVGSQPCSGDHTTLALVNVRVTSHLSTTSIGTRVILVMLRTLNNQTTLEVKQIMITSSFLQLPYLYKKPVQEQYPRISARTSYPSHQPAHLAAYIVLIPPRIAVVPVPVVAAVPVVVPTILALVRPVLLPLVTSLVTALMPSVMASLMSALVAALSALITAMLLLPGCVVVIPIILSMPLAAVPLVVATARVLSARRRRRRNPDPKPGIPGRRGLPRLLRRRGVLLVATIPAA